MKKILPVLILSSAVILNCYANAKPLTSKQFDHEKKIKKFTLTDRNGLSMEGIISYKGIVVLVPENVDITHLKANFTTTGEKITIDDIKQTNNYNENNFSNPITYTVHAKDGTSKDYTVVIKKIKSIIPKKLLSLYNVNGNIKDTSKFSFLGVTSSNQNKFVAVGDNGNLQPAIALYFGEKWQIQNNPAEISDGTYIPGITANNNGKFVAVGGDGGFQGYILNSIDGANWNIVDSSLETTLNSVAVNSQGKYVAVGDPDDNSTVYTSIDGDKWNKKLAIKNPKELYAITVSQQDKFVAVGAKGTILSSIDGNTWISESSPSKKLQLLADTVNNQGKFVAVGNKSIISSTDGNNWITESSPNTLLTGVAVNSKNRFIAVGEDGTILKSDGNKEWLPINEKLIPDNSGLLAVTVDDKDKFVAVGNKGVILTSVDGDTWIKEEIPQS